MRYFTRFVIIGVVGAVALAPLNTALSDDWPQLGFDPQHSSFNPYESVLQPDNVGDLGVLWSRSVPCTINTCVSVVDNLVYYGHYCGVFLAVDAGSGATIWEMSVGGVHNGQAVVDGVAFVVFRCTYSHCGTLYALDAQTGAPLWTWDQASRWVGDPVVSEGIVFVLTEVGADSTVHALDAYTGGELWQYSGTELRPAAVAGGVVYVTQANGVAALDAATGELLWTGLLSGAEVNSMAVVANDSVYVNADDGYLYAFDAGGCGEAMCPPLWRAAVGRDYLAPQPPAVADGKLFVGAGDSFFAFDAEGCGADECPPLWTTTTACSYYPGRKWPPSVANGVVYSACGSNYLYAFDAETGDVLWSYYTSGGNELRGSPVIVDGRLFHPATFDFRLYAFELPYGDCPGDITGDGVTDQADLGILIALWGVCDDHPNYDPDADLNGDGCISQPDLGILLADWGCPTEP